MITESEVFASLVEDYERIHLIPKFKKFIAELDDTDIKLLPVIKAGNLLLETHLRARECKETILLSITQILMCALCNGYMGDMVVEIMDLNNKYMTATAGNLLEEIISDDFFSLNESKGRMKQ